LQLIRFYNSLGKEWQGITRKNSSNYEKQKKNEGTPYSKST